ncbi:hypothetical protein Tco_1119346 [Tanacetum coccineum]
MTKVIKGEYEKIKDVKVKDVSLTCDTSLEVFNNEVNRLSGMDDDLEHEADDDMGYDSSDVAFTEWLGSKIFNYKTMDHYTMKALWIYYFRGDDEVEITDEESSDDMDEVVETYLLRTLRDSRPMKITRMIGSMNGTRTYHGWMDDGYYNGGNLPGTYIIENQLHYQDYEWYEALKDSELKDEALRNKAIMEGFIKEDDDESRYEQMRQWNINANYNDAYETNHGDNRYVVVKEDEYDNLTITREEACQAYQEIFRIMDEGWMDLMKEISTKLVECIFSGILLIMEYLVKVTKARILERGRGEMEGGVLKITS